MKHSSVWLFNMERCCDNQLDELIPELQRFQRWGITKGNVAMAQYPTASNEDHLFSSMRLRATLKDDETVEIEGIVYYHDMPYSQKSVIICTFPDLDECLAWITNTPSVCTKFVKVLDEHC